MIEGDVLMPIDSGASRVLAFSVFFPASALYSSPQATPPVPSKGAQSAGSSVVNAPSPDVSKYVGAETCKACHEAIYNAWEKTPHWKTTLDTKGGPSHQGCEGCHGPGADHVAGGGDKTKIFVFEAKSRQGACPRCLSCHAGGPQHMNTINSLHT